MKYKLLLTLSFLLLVFQLSAQRIHFCDSTNHWITLSTATAVACQNNYWYIGDTVVGTHSYRIMEDSFTSYCCWPLVDTTSYTLVREDTTAGLVYVLFNDTDRILYNYNLAVGDTFFATYLPTPYAYYDEIVDTHSVTINGLSYRVWDTYEIDTLSHVMTFGSYDFHSETDLEGIGCMFGPLFAMDTINGSTREEVLQCFYQTNTPLYDTPSFSFRFQSYGAETLIYTNCHPSLGVTKYNNSNTKAVVVPNPVYKDAVIELSYPMSRQIKVMNYTGQIIYALSILNTKEISLNNVFCTPGIYFYSITDRESSSSITGKILYSP